MTACGAGEDRVDPGDLELRDILGIAPEVAGGWDADQRAAARRVIESGLHPRPDAQPSRGTLVNGAALDRRIASSLASLDASRARRHAGALGLVAVATRSDELLATPRVTSIEPHASVPLEIRFAGWDAEPAHGRDLLSAIATDAGHRSGPIVVTAVPRLTVIAGYLAATPAEPARLLVNPIVVAALEPVDPGPPTAVERLPTTPAVAPAPDPLTMNAGGNPYSFYGSVAECASAQRTRCTRCLGNGSCTAITDGGDGNAECTQLGASSGRGYFLICVNLALAIDSVSSCAAGQAPSCARDIHASESLSSLENNASFLDDAACRAPLDSCLATVFGPPDGSFPEPGSDRQPTRPARNTSVGCDNSRSGSTSCESEPGGCELDGPSCDSEQSSGCDDSGGDESCSGDGEDACGSSDNSSCDSSDGGSGGDCDGGGGGGDCGGGGGGGDCGDSSCNAAARRRGAGGGLSIAVGWALLPLPFATFARRRADRRRARAEADRGAS